MVQIVTWIAVGLLLVVNLVLLVQVWRRDEKGRGRGGNAKRVAFSS